MTSVNNDRSGEAAAVHVDAFDLFSHRGSTGPVQDEGGHSAEHERRHSDDQAGPGQPLEMRFSEDDRA